ncbi:MAG: T9SS C-terminal target domain-containing protein [Ignavibacteriae bacterium]|nr:MAG: T9SS C-terminal target domain-containing protein [Ignavibacteriota bacterium]
MAVFFNKPELLTNLKKKMRKDHFTKLLVLAIAIVSLSASSVFAQATAVSQNSIQHNEGMIGAQCVGGLVYDDNTWENGYGWNPGYGIGKWALKMTPATYPFTINQVCLSLTRTAAGSANWTFDIVFYDATGTGGGPGTLVHTIANQVATGVPIWPTVSWFDFTGLSGIPPLSSGQSYYVGLSYDPATMPSHYIGADESATTTMRPGYGYIQSAWAGIQTYFPSYKCIGVRADGTGQTFAHNIAVGPFLSLPGLFNSGVQKVIKAKVQNQGTSNESAIPMKFFVNGTQVNTSTIATLNAGAVDSVAYNWTPADTGNYVLKIVSALATDEFRGNDTVTTTVHVYPVGYFSTCWGTGSTAVGYPFYTFYMDARTDMLYTAAEIGLGAPATIQKIGFTVLSAAPQVMNGFKLRMQNTTLTTLTSFTSSGWTDVYTGTYSITTPGLMYITLQNNFAYTGGNLLVEICFNNSSYTSNSTVASTANAGRVYYNYQDISAGDGCVQITSGTTPPATLPNVCFQGTVPTGIQNPSGIPAEFSLSQNYPNPFNPSTVINFALPKTSNVKLTVFDALGRVVTTLVNETRKAGNHSVEFNASNLASGLYIYKIEAGDFTATKKMLLVK